MGWGWKIKGYRTMTMPPPLGFGNWKARKRELIQLLTELAPFPLSVDLAVFAELTVPSPVITNFTVILPPRVGLALSSL